MGIRNRIRPFTILLLVATVVLIVVFQAALCDPEIPPGARRKLPTGPVTPMVSMGGTYGLILAGDGSLWSWGSNFLGTTNMFGWPVLGLGNVSNTPYLRRIGSDKDWVYVSAGDSQNVAIKSDGTLWEWGQNGIGTKMPAQVSSPRPGAPGKDWKQAEATSSATIALKKDGTLWAWGINSAGELGVGVTNDALIPTQIGSRTNWVRVWAGAFQSAGMLSDGTLWFWGSNPTLGVIAQRSPANFLAPVRLSPDTNWVDVAFGVGVMLAIKADGTLWAWGERAGTYSDNANRSVTNFAQVGTNTDWRSIYSGAVTYNLLATKKDGSVWSLEAWQRLGPGVSPLGKVRFTRVKIPDAAVALGTARFRAGVALGRDGEVWTWGEMLGTNAPARPAFQTIAKWANKIKLKVHWGDAHPIVREKPWLLPNIDPDSPSGK